MKFRILLIAVFSLIMVSCQSGNQKKNLTGSAPDVVIAYESWSEDVAFAAFTKRLLEEEGFSVKTVQVDNGYRALKNKKADLFLAYWEPNDYYKDSADTLLSLGYLYTKAKIGFVVPKYMDAHTIDDVEKFKKELGGKIYVVNPNSEGFAGLNEATKRYNFSLEMEEVTETEMMSLFMERYKNKQPICITGWFPHPMLNLEHLRVLDDPFGAFTQEYNLVKYCNPSWAKKHPKLVSFFTKYDISKEHFKVLIDKVEENNWNLDKGIDAWYKALSPEYKQLFK